MASLDQLFRSALMMAIRRAVVVGIVFIFIVPSSAISDQLAKVEITDSHSFPIDRSKRSLPSESPASVNIIQRILFNQTQMNKSRGNIKEQLKQIADQLIRPSQVLITSFERGILQRPLHKINNSLTSFGRYLNDPDNQTLSNNFFQDATALPATLQALLDILGRADIVSTLIDALKCHGRKLKDTVEHLMKSVVAGFWVNAEYQRMRNPFDDVTWSFNKSVGFNPLLWKRLEEEVLQCRTDERNVTSEMLRILQTKSKLNRADLTNHLLGLLEDKYDTKKWIVVVINETVGDDNIKHIESTGFHTVTNNGLFALAISVADPADSPELYKLKSRTFDNFFKFPFNKDPSTVSESPRWDLNDIFYYTNRYLTPLRAATDVETLVVRTPCTLLEKNVHLMQFVTIKSSTELGKVYLTNNGVCANYLVMAVIKTSTDDDNQQMEHSKCYTSDSQGNLLRNEVVQNYLTVKDDSILKSYVVMKDKKDSKAQRWRFVNLTVRSDSGKCLTAENGGIGSDVLAQDCVTPLSEKQKWTRHGLQIVNGFNNCLKEERGKVIQDDCKYIPPYLWYDWDVDCEDAVVLTSPVANNYLPLRNEFSRRYLSLNKGGWVTQQPWGDQSDQYWQFINGRFLNKKNGKCLTNNSNYFFIDDCAESGNQWNYRKNQITDGAKCLTIPEDGTSPIIVQSQCKDHPAHYWRFDEKPTPPTLMALKVLPNNSAVDSDLYSGNNDVADNLFYLLVEDKHRENGKWIKVACFNLGSIFQQKFTEKLNKTQLQIQSKQMEDRLKSLEKEMEESGIHQHMIDYNKKNSSSAASQSMETNENKIKKSLSSLLNYLNSSNNSREMQDDFFKTANTLPSAIKALIDGLLGQNSDKIDTMMFLKEVFNCYGIILEKKVNLISSIAMTGIWVHDQYQRINYIRTFSSSLNSMEFTQLMLDKVEKRLAQQVSSCRDDMGNVREEMRKVMETLKDRKTIADALLRHLESKYNNRKWLVVVHDGVQSYNLTEGFYNASVDGSTFAAAISVSGQELSPFSVNRFNEFRFPIKTVSKELKSIEEAQDIHRCWNRYLGPFKLGIESTVIVTPCGKEIKDYVTIVNSRDFIWKRIANQDKCANKRIIVVPVSNNLQGNCSQHLDNVQLSDGWLRNEVDDKKIGYLSVQGDTAAEGTSITLDPGWRNVTGQRWRFVNNQLVNGYGKCLTAWTPRSLYLYQYDCHPDWAGQIWIRHGLQIVNGFRYCLASQRQIDDYVIQDNCDSTPQFLWDWDVECKEKI